MRWSEKGFAAAVRWAGILKEILRGHLERDRIWVRSAQFNSVVVGRVMLRVRREEEDQVMQMTVSS